MTRILTHTFLTICYLLHGFIGNAQQPYGNEWIDYNRPYLRIPVVETGIYKITAPELAAHRIPVDSISISGIRMFRHGIEQAIEVQGSLSGILGLDGYIVFDGQRNDGKIDSSLYTSPGAMPHPFYNLYSDTSAYFLTWKDDGKLNLRTKFPTPGAATDTATVHWEELLQLFTSHYLPGRFFPAESSYDNGSLLTAYDEGEGWTGPQIANNMPFEVVLKTNNLVRSGSLNVNCEMLLAGWAPGMHSFALWSGSSSDLKRKLTDIMVTGRETKRIHFQLPAKDFDVDGLSTLTLMPTGVGGHVSVSYVRMRYLMAGKRVAPEPMRILAPRLVHFAPIDSKTEYLIITHPLMRAPVTGLDPVDEYVHYRISKKGGGYKTMAVHSYELYDQFNGGQPGPQGIRNAIRWLNDQGHLKFVLLAGRSIDPQKARKMKEAWQTDMIPNAGWPGSDIALTMGKKNPFPSVPIGRINALNARQLLDYLRKVQAVEAEPASSKWRKRIMHLSGGRSLDELNLFRTYIKSFEEKLSNSSLANHVTSISKLTDNAVEEIQIDKQVNEGVALMTLFGHSAIDVTDIDIGRAGDPARNYQNHPRYPAIMVNGCAAGSIFYSTQTLSSDWIFAPESGAVLFLAHTFNGPSTALKRYTDIFYEVLADSAFTSKPFGIIQQEAIRRNMIRAPGILDSITVQQMTLHGDPSIRIFPASLPGYVSDSQFVESKQLPIILVTFDGRQLANGEYVSAKPNIRIRFFDDDLPTANDDTTLVSIWLKQDCAGCTDVRIPMHQVSGKNMNGDFYEIIFQPVLEPGKYTLTIQCRDLAGHSSRPYKIHFEVPDRTGSIQATVFPNPSDRWFKFVIYSEQPVEHDVELTILNPLGTTVFQKLLHCRTGRNEWFWSPGTLLAGFYHYTIHTAETTGSPPLSFGDMHGHLLYSP
ncbi:C25 family cysteine peptidase [Dyadobacter sp. CY261]|uniref:C25 family cysteine peptidase n=1 Tax=Dyadobacter sp. CY261 TaxID=2907203 RepID=UPI001F313885|nr:C25 family cysteine peptidase [Dyadobacter sp. CY261]MCF0072147.1 C25 family cysteine peptidase [Dyadobacter sp. CY261]